jgi:thiosulfate dehydrogenase
MRAKNLFLFFITAGFATLIYSSCNQNSTTQNNSANAKADSVWHSPDTSTWATEPNATQLRYGRELIANTSHYLGPKGTVAQLSNGMNCQNCHQQAGTKTFGNNYGAVAATYPTFRPRSGRVENIKERINECLERSMNGKGLDTNSKETQAIAAYINWVGKGIAKGKVPRGAGAGELTYMDRAADTNKGQQIYYLKCTACHGSGGKGLANGDETGYQYPPLWGPHSYNTGASMSRIGKLATYIKNNMPFGVTYDTPQLTDDEAWDLAAFIDSRPRPVFNDSGDWPDLKNKPIDFPTGPYADNFSEQQHKYGPYKPIIEAKKHQQTPKA